jgi:hypothetical protein
MAGDIERFHPDVPKELGKYLIPTESIIFVIRRHWIILVEPVLSTLLGLFVVAFISMKADSLTLAEILFGLWVLLFLRMMWEILEWSREYFLATNRRLMLVHGLITRTVDIMPMAKVTDMRYDRTVTGQLFGYGIYVLESAGQDQALSTINFIPDPDRHYQQISAVIFAPSLRRNPESMGSNTTGSQIPIADPERSWWRR